jgi:hypothetical protein
VIRALTAGGLAWLVAHAAFPGAAAAETAAPGLAVTLLGPARAISRSDSASRDTAVLGMMALPRAVLTGGGDFALVRVALAGMSFRLGLFAMFELESDAESDGASFGFGFPQGDIRFWRGVVGYSLAASFDSFAQSRCGRRCALEATLSLRHESEHYTGSNSGDPGTDFRHVPHIGDFVMPDAALRLPLGELDLVARAQLKVFLPRRSGYRLGPGGDLGARWRRWERVHPFSSVFAEYLTGDGAFPDAFLVRNLTGVVLPSDHGDLYLFLSADVGHRKGLAVYTREATLGLGARAAFY